MGKLLKSGIFILLALIISILLMSSSPGVVEAHEHEERYGGTINIAQKMAVSHLDSDNSTDWLITSMMNHVYEGLFEFDENLEAQPHLAKDYEITDEGRKYIVELREGVLFHNGDEMTSDDVIASFNRWLEVNGAGSTVAPYFKEIERVDDYKLNFVFEEPYAPFINILASPVSNQKFVVRHQDIIEEFGSNVITDHIGTGPYKYVDWIPDRNLRLERFEDYQASPLESSYYAGERIPYIENVVYEFITEPTVRVSGVQTGQFDFAEEVSTDQFEMFDANPDIEPVVIYPDQMAMFIMNNAQPPFNNKYARQAMVYALDLEELGYSMIGNPEFWRLEASLHEEGNPWHSSTAGQGIYNNYDPEKAEELLEKAGYDGTPLVILSGQDDRVERQGAIAIKDQLEKIGVEVELQLFDRPTVVERRAKEEGWNIHLSTFSKIVPDPQIHQGWTGTNKWILNWDDEDSVKMDEIFARMMVETDYEARYEIVDEFYDFMWETVPYFNMLDFSRLNIVNSSVQNFQEAWQPFFWNIWFE